MLDVDVDDDAVFSEGGKRAGGSLHRWSTATVGRWDQWARWAR